jgi:5-methylcytosine-specific restriction endonuclease McrA
MGFWTKYFSQQIFGNWLGGYIWSADRTAKYREYLKSDAWQRKRYVVLKRDNWTCQYCGAKATQVHHKRYAKYKIGKEPIKWLVSLCKPCHEKQH